MDRCQSDLETEDKFQELKKRLKVVGQTEAVNSKEPQKTDDIKVVQETKGNSEEAKSQSQTQTSETTQQKSKVETGSLNLQKGNEKPSEQKPTNPTKEEPSAKSKNIKKRTPREINDPQEFPNSSDEDEPVKAPKYKDEPVQQEKSKVKPTPTPNVNNSSNQVENKKETGRKIDETQIRTEPEFQHKKEEPKQESMDPQSPSTEPKKEVDQPQTATSGNSEKQTPPTQDTEKPISQPEREILAKNMESGPVYYLFLFLNYWQLILGIFVGFLLGRII